MKKGETYTFSMYVKAEISALESVGKCFLRAQCYDKDGKSMQYDSESVRRTTDGFLQLSVFFTVPKDAKNDTVNLYLHLYHVKRTLYGDVAQLEQEIRQTAVTLWKMGLSILEILPVLQKSEQRRTLL